jgi:protein-S-isoprenylcysteine O-methyltransferase Ste14
MLSEKTGAVQISSWHGKYMMLIKKMLGVGPHLLLIGIIIESLTIICHQRVAWPIRLNLETRILLTILCGIACFLCIIWMNRLLMTIGINLSKEQNELIKVGPFAYVRHPLYSNLIMTIPPLLIIWYEDLLFFIPWTIIIVVSHFVVSIEERGLVDIFGEAYEEYRRTVPALIPYKGSFGKPLKGD